MKRSYYIVAALFLLGYLLQQNGQFAFLIPGSQLGFFETRIQGPASELMRRSPELAANFEDFRTCRQSSDCEPSAIFAQRDVAVRAAWPEVFDRLVVRQDWDTCTHTNGCEDIDVDHDLFEEALAKEGLYRLRYLCVPHVVYLFRPYDGAVYDTRGYDCPP